MNTWQMTSHDHKTLKCPGCFEGDSLRRSHGRLRDIPFRLVGMRTYRCLTCYRRFHTWKKAEERSRPGGPVRAA
jgi:C4-type Zn-finger protein